MLNNGKPDLIPRHNTKVLKKAASFLYTSANLNDFERLKKLYLELETIEFRKDQRHEKFMGWVDFDIGDDCNEGVTIINY